MFKVKICCIRNIEEAKMAMHAGAYALGLVGRMPSGPGIISDERIARIAAQIPGEVHTFLLTSEKDPGAIIRHHQKVLTDTIQIVDGVKPEAITLIRKALPSVQIIPVIHVLDNSSIDEALKIDHLVDAILLDSGNPGAPVKELGGTGRTHNWEISREINDVTRSPVILAGGLNADNVVRAIERVQPYAVDLCSGVRTNGILDQKKLEQFFHALPG
jgi:phosphoribosylanthranilate isomerase